MTNATAHATTYVGHNKQDAQNGEMLYHFLIESLSLAFKGQV